MGRKPLFSLWAALWFLRILRFSAVAVGERKGSYACSSAKRALSSTITRTSISRFVDRSQTMTRQDKSREATPTAIALTGSTAKSSRGIPTVCEKW